MKRSPFVRKPKRRKAAAMRAMAKNKATGKMLCTKGPARDPEHLAKVRAQNCIACFNTPASEAHHVRCLRPTLGKRVSDYWTVPLCRFHHQHPIFGAHGFQGEVAFWDRIGIDPCDFIRSFSPEGAAALASLERKEAA